MFGSLKLLTVRGIPIRIHWSLLLLLPWFAWRYSNMLEFSWAWGGLTAIGLFASVALHELGHSFTGMAKGIRTVDIVLTPIGGIARLARIPTRAMDELHIAIAGPLVSIALGGLFYGLLRLAMPLLSEAAQLVLWVLAVTNIALAVFNLIPCFPMDGGRVFRALMSRKWGRLEATRRAVTLGGWLAAALFVWGLINTQVLTMVIAWFVYSSARSEYRMVQLQETAQRMNPFDTFFRGPPPGGAPPPIEVTVSPPPYGRE